MHPEAFLLSKQMVTSERLIIFLKINCEGVNSENISLNIHFNYYILFRFMVKALLHLTLLLSLKRLKNVWFILFYLKLNNTKEYNFENVHNINQC